MPAFLIKKIRGWYPEDAEAFLNSQFEERHGTTVRIYRRASLEETIGLLKEDGCKVEKAPYADRCYDVAPGAGGIPVGELKAFREGRFEVMDAASALVVQCAAPEKGSRCLDVCGAPGGKSIGLADVLEGTGLVDCRDISRARLELAEENAAKAGFDNLEFHEADALAFRPEDEGRFDLVLADLPCSGLGVLSRKPDLKYRITDRDFSQLRDLQRRILGSAMRAVRQGGVLIYSTCTVNPGENGENADFILQSGKFTAESLRPFLTEIPEGCDPDTGRLQLLPGRNRCDGFFISRFRKTDD
ncbi:MAG: RsmB/NOP family class I SAM-dependent RNA methyltransferase [Lachnospiraceae bacterium]|jgi:16S rRNA (cytosine967-C5)-methyltransferase